MKEALLRLLAHAGKTLRRSGICFDSPRLLERMIEDPEYSKKVSTFARLRFSPDIFPRIERHPAPLETRRKMHALAVCRLPKAAQSCPVPPKNRLSTKAILRVADTISDPCVLTAAALDGASVLPIIRALSPARVDLTDKHPFVFRKKCGPAVLFADSDGALFGLKLGFLFVRLEGTPSGRTDWERVPMDNPALVHAGSGPVHFFDVFYGRHHRPASIINCPNLLCPKRFDELSLRVAVRNLGRNLEDGGYLCLSHEDVRYKQGEAWFMLRREQDRLVFFEGCNNHAAERFFRKGLHLAGGNL